MSKRQYLTDKQEAVYRAIERGASLWFPAYEIAASYPELGLDTGGLRKVLQALAGHGLLVEKKLTREEAAHHLHYGTKPLDLYRLATDAELHAKPPSRWPHPR